MLMAQKKGATHAVSMKKTLARRLFANSVDGAARAGPLFARRLGVAFSIWTGELGTETKTLNHSLASAQRLKGIVGELRLRLGIVPLRSLKTLTFGALLSWLLFARSNLIIFACGQ